MAGHLVVSCCLPGATTSSRAKAAAASSSSPPSSNLKPTNSRGDHTRIGRRDFVLRSSELATLAAIFHFSGTKPTYLGVQKNPPSLALCPATNNCVSTSEEISDSNHYAPPWNYNPKDGRRGKPVTKEEAMKELIEVFVDDVEFWFPPGNKPIVQYRTASRSGFVDFNANKKRVKELRLALEKKGWASESNF
ncbi:uncharacterized protein LOC120649020 isoform X2 [Panicum virgatum]|uniref:uncharacterized protein LOC120649020 isoform X2 n=1 Tax=Panicum virgatum TaxID=38727 RepID=UPI0019D691BD|nr:uncharacterized protein LOC120649020 isoform X2 [Panicum virgatum]